MLYRDMCLWLRASTARLHTTDSELQSAWGHEYGEDVGEAGAIELAVSSKPEVDEF